MPQFLERYLNGEYEQVWAELLELGAQIRDEPLYSDALAVARETMNRARKNEADIDFEELTAEEILEASFPYVQDISGDSITKAGYSGSIYSIGLPNPAIDGYIIGASCNFVEYLRKSFQWGGFIGLAKSANPPKEELAFLTKDLLPI